jgi:hypothetical protein
VKDVTSPKHGKQMLKGGYICAFSLYFSILHYFVSAVLHLNGYNAVAMGLDFADKTLNFCMYY